MARTRLLDLLLAHSYRYDPSAPVRLASGKISPYYVDCKATTMRGDAKDLVAELFLEHLPPGVRSVGGLTMGADPIANAIACYATRHGRPMDAFAVRKEVKKHGLGKWIEGCAPSGTRVAVVDDVVTTGNSTIEAIRKCRDERLQVEAVIVLVDREEEGGIEAIKHVAGTIPVVAIFKLAELHGAQQHPTRSRSAQS